MTWDPEQYWKKAVRYVEMAADPQRDPWERPFWLSLALEFLARAALTAIHPALNADPGGDGLNLLYAFGVEVKGQPRSLPIHAVLLRLERVYPGVFTQPHREFCDFFSNLRNQELHTSGLSFEGLAETKWLARFYDVCFALCARLGRDPRELLGAEEFETAGQLVAALKTDRVGSVKKRVAEHGRAFQEKPEAERAQLRSQLDVLSKGWEWNQTRVACPACGSWARLQGSVERSSQPFYDGEQLLVRNVVLANRLNCDACELALVDIEELHIAQVEPHFEYFEATDLHEYHEADYDDEYDNM